MDPQVVADHLVKETSLTAQHMARFMEKITGEKLQVEVKADDDAINQFHIHATGEAAGRLVNTLKMFLAATLRGSELRSEDSDGVARQELTVYMGLSRQNSQVMRDALRNMQSLNDQMDGAPQGALLRRMMEVSLELREKTPQLKASIRFEPPEGDAIARPILRIQTDPDEYTAVKSLQVDGLRPELKKKGWVDRAKVLHRQSQQYDCTTPEAIERVREAILASPAPERNQGRVR